MMNDLKNSRLAKIRASTKSFFILENDAQTSTIHLISLSFFNTYVVSLTILA